AYIDDRRTGLEHGRGVCVGLLRIVEELAAIGKAVGRHVEDAHDLRLVEADGPLSQLQRRMRRGETGPLRFSLGPDAVRQPSKRRIDPTRRDKIALHDFAVARGRDGKQVSIVHAAGETDSVAAYRLRAGGKRQRLDVESVQNNLRSWRACRA